MHQRTSNCNKTAGAPAHQQLWQTGAPAHHRSSSSFYFSPNTGVGGRYADEAFKKFVPLPQKNFGPPAINICYAKHGLTHPVASPLWRRRTAPLLGHDSWTADLYQRVYTYFKPYLLTMWYHMLYCVRWMSVLHGEIRDNRRGLKFG